MALTNYYYDIERQKIGAIPQQLRAIPQVGYTKLLQQKAASDVGRTLQQQDIASRLMRQQYQTALPEQFLKTAKREYKKALPITIAGVGLAGLGAYSDYRAEKQRQKEQEELELLYKMLMKIVEENAGRIAKAYSIPSAEYRAAFRPKQ